MPWLLVAIGFAFGLSSGSAIGALGGAALGYLFGMLLQQHRRVRELESDSIQLWAKLQSIAPDEPAAASEPQPKRAATEPAPGPIGGPEAAEASPPRRSPSPPPTPPPLAPERPARPRAPHRPPPRASSPFDVLPDRIRSYLTGASLMVTLGVVVLFFGVAFLLKYAVDQGLLSIELRLIGAAAFGIAMLAFGFRARERRPSFSRALQGGGVGVLYLTVFAAYRLYQVLPGGLTFVLLAAFVALSGLLAVLQDARALALLATTGGFLAPVLASTGQGSHVALFSYYVVLNAGILAISWFKSWRSVNLAGFVFTFVLSGAWALRYYTPTYFATTEPFLIAFFSMYVAIAVAFALRQEPRRVGLVDGTLVFGVPLVAAAFQAGLVKDFEYGLAWSALALGVFYLGLASVLFRIRGKPLQALSEAFLGEGVVFATLAVPFAFDGLVTSAFWALEGAAILWVGVRQNRLTPRLFGATLQVLAGIAFLVDGGRHGTVPLANPHLLGATLIAVAALASSLHLSRRNGELRAIERHIGWGFFGYGLLWWLGGGIHEIETFVHENEAKAGALLLFFSFTAAVSFFVGGRLSWGALQRVSLGLLPSFLVGLVATSDAVGHPFEGLAAVGWIVGLATFYFLLHAAEDREPSLAPYWHAGGFALVGLLLAWESSFRADRLPISDAWSNVLWGLVPAGALLGLFSRGRRLRWPFGKHWQAYATLGAGPVAAALVLWILAINATPGDPAPLPYVPLANPIDISVAFSLLALVAWRRAATAWFDDDVDLAGLVQAILGALAFLTLHGVIVRTVHAWTGVPFSAEALFRSVVVQSAVAVLWAVTGLSSMVLGTRLGLRSVWTMGAVLMGGVVLKLFLIDLSHTDTVARIVSFLGVGTLLLAVGYLSPVPPRDARAELAS